MECPLFAEDAKNGPPQIDADSPVERLKTDGDWPTTSKLPRRTARLKQTLGVAILGGSC
jgi:hypothetical protein